MKNYRNLLAVLSVLNVLGAVACLIIMFVSMNSGNDFWPTYIPIACSLFINAIIFAYVDDLGSRVDKMEEILKRNGILFEEPKKEPKPKEFQTVFRPGEPVKLRNKVAIEGKEFVQDSSGMVIDKKENNLYVIEFDNERGIKYEINGDNLKSFFDN